MNAQREAADAARAHYADAYATHYTVKDLAAAVRSYDNLIDLHPSSPEAEYARSQIQNIAGLVVSPGDLLAAHVKLVLEHFGAGPR